MTALDWTMILAYFALLAGVVVLDGETMAAMKEGDIAKKMAIVMTDDALLDPRAKEMENIRKYVLGNDLIETIVRTKAKPKIRKFSCIYILNKKKLAKRRGKIQIINIENEMVEGKDIVLQAYKEFRNRVYEDGDYMIESRILSTADYEGMLIRKE